MREGCAASGAALQPQSGVRRTIIYCVRQRCVIGTCLQRLSSSSSANALAVATPARAAMATALNSFLGRLSVGLILGSTLMLLALNLSGPPGSPGSLNGYGYADVYAYHVREEEEGGHWGKAPEEPR